MKGSTRNYLNLGTKAFAIRTAVQQVRLARREDDALRLLDAVLNLLTVATAVAILIREFREHDDLSDAIEEVT